MGRCQGLSGRKPDVVCNSTRCQGVVGVVRQPERKGSLVEHQTKPNRQAVWGRMRRSTLQAGRHESGYALPTVASSARSQTNTISTYTGMGGTGMGDDHMTRARLGTSLHANAAVPVRA